MMKTEKPILNSAGRIKLLLLLITWFLLLLWEKIRRTKMRENLDIMLLLLIY